LHERDYLLIRAVEQKFFANGVGVRVFILVMSIASALLTFRLGLWQWSRAEQKWALDDSVKQAQSLAPMNNAQLMELQNVQDALNRRVEVEGRWLNQWTVLLDNRPQNSQAGFWVITPFELSPQMVLMVQRGWIPRDPLQRDVIAPFETPSGWVKISARISQGPSKMFELPKPFHNEAQTPAEQTNFVRIRQNIDRSAFALESGLDIKGDLIELGDNSEGLVRDWPVVSVSAARNVGYAFQWFCLTLLIVFLYIWYQIIKPLKHAK
jgi:surfeit locus 1 family protein